MRSRALIIVFILETSSGWCQIFTLQAGGGIGAYDMSTLIRSEQVWAQQYSPVPLKITDSFAPSPYVDIQFRASFSRILTTGICYRRLSSGMRGRYEDYSGFIEHKQRVDAQCIGLLVAVRILSKKQFVTRAGIEVYMVWDRYQYDANRSFTGGNGNPESVGIDARSVIYNPFAEESYSRGPWSVTLKLGYSFDTKGQTNFALFYIPAVAVDWSGFRVGLSIGFSF